MKIANRIGSLDLPIPASINRAGNEGAGPESGHHKPRYAIWLCGSHQRRLQAGHRVKLKPTASARAARAPKIA
jgi:hypothetical protein